MCYENVIRYISTSNKSILEGCNKRIHKRLKSIYHYFRNDFIDHIAQIDGPKMMNFIREVDFWNEGYIGMVKGFQ